MPTFAEVRRVAFPADRPVFYYITDRKQLPGEDLLGTVQRALRWGVDFIQIREKDLSDRELYNLTREVVRRAHRRRCRVLVNGRADIALAVGADGVHLPSRGFPARDLRSLVPQDFLIGASVHSLREARIAVRAGVDYLLAGPIYPTPSKLRYGLPLRLGRFAGICRSVNIPVIGLGGIHPTQVPDVIAAGAAGVAGITLFQRELAMLTRERGILRKLTDVARAAG